MATQKILEYEYGLLLLLLLSAVVRSAFLCFRETKILDSSSFSLQGPLKRNDQAHQHKPTKLYVIDVLYQLQTNLYCC